MRTKTALAAADGCRRCGGRARRRKDRSWVRRRSRRSRQSRPHRRRGTIRRSSSTWRPRFRSEIASARSYAPTRTGLPAASGKRRCISCSSVPEPDAHSDPRRRRDHHVTARTRHTGTAIRSQPCDQDALLLHEVAARVRSEPTDVQLISEAIRSARSSAPRARSGMRAADARIRARPGLAMSSPRIVRTR